MHATYSHIDIHRLASLVITGLIHNCETLSKQCGAHTCVHSTCQYPVDGCAQPPIDASVQPHTHKKNTHHALRFNYAAGAYSPNIRSGKRPVRSAVPPAACRVIGISKQHEHFDVATTSASSQVRRALMDMSVNVSER